MESGVSGLKSGAPMERRPEVSIECAIVYIVVSACGVYVAYQLGRAQVYGEWKLWLEEALRKLEDEEVRDDSVH